MRSSRPRYKHIDRVLARVLKDEPPELPIDVFRLMRASGYQLKSVDLGSRSAAMKRQGEGAIVLLNSKDPTIRQRYAAAHVLGHILLHPEMEEHFDEAFRILGRNTQLSHDMNIKEKEANYFSLMLLVPEASLKSELSQAQIDKFGEIDIPTIAAKFHVTNNLMIVRLCGMKNYFNVLSAFLDL